LSLNVIVILLMRHGEIHQDILFVQTLFTGTTGKAFFIFRGKTSTYCLFPIKDSFTFNHKYA